MKYLSIFFTLLLSVTLSGQTDSLMVDRTTHRIKGLTTGAQFREANAIVDTVEGRTIYVSKSTTSTDTRTGLQPTDIPFTSPASALTAAAALTPTELSPVFVIIKNGNYTCAPITLNTAHIRIYMHPGAILSFATGGITRTAKNIHIVGGKILGTSGNAGPLLDDTEFTGNVTAYKITNLTPLPIVGAYVADYDNHLLKDVTIDNGVVGVAIGDVYGGVENVKAFGTYALKEGWGCNLFNSRFVGSIRAVRMRTLLFRDNMGDAGDIEMNQNYRRAQAKSCDFVTAMQYGDAVCFDGWGESNQTAFNADPYAENDTAPNIASFNSGNPAANGFMVHAPQLKACMFQCPDGHNTLNTPDNPYLGGGIDGSGDFEGCMIWGINPIRKAEGHLYFVGCHIVNNWLDSSYMIKFVRNTLFSACHFNGQYTGKRGIGDMEETRFVNCSGEGSFVDGFPTPGHQKWFWGCSDFVDGPFGARRNDIAVRFTGNLDSFATAWNSSRYNYTSGTDITIECWVKATSFIAGADQAIAVHSPGVLVTGAPVKLQKAAPHNLIDGQLVRIAGVTGGIYNIPLNGTHKIIWHDKNTFFVSGVTATVAGSGGTFGPAEQGLISCTNGSGTGWLISAVPAAMNGGTPQLYTVFRTGNIIANGATANVLDGNWNHVMVTASGTALKMYVNGKLIGSNASAVSTLNVNDLTNQNRLIIGGVGYQTLTDTNEATEAFIGISAAMTGAMRQIRISQGIRREDGTTVGTTYFTPAERYLPPDQYTVLQLEHETVEGVTVTQPKQIWSDKRGKAKVKLTDSTLIISEDKSPNP